MNTRYWKTWQVVAGVIIPNLTIALCIDLLVVKGSPYWAIALFIAWIVGVVIYTANKKKSQPQGG